MKLQIHSFVNWQRMWIKHCKICKKAQDWQKKCADQRRRDLEVQVGDEVLLSTKNLLVLVVARGSRKLGPLYCGTILRIRKVNSGLQIGTTTSHADTSYRPCVPIKTVPEAKEQRTEI